MTGTAMALYGTNEPVEEEIGLEAGPLSALFVNGALRNIRLQDVEVIRGIYFLIRDRNWSTVVPEIRDLQIDRQKDAFRLTFTAHGVTPSDGQALDWHGTVEGSAKAGITFRAHARPDTDFVTCRTGFIVLHPLEKVVGSAVTVEHTDGSIEESHFPDLIDPIQSFFDIRAMTHEPLPGIRATCRMEGGAWETEDHRNWMDASFKTYFRPLMLPWPYTVPAGEKIEQSVSLTFAPAIAKLAPVAADATVTVSVGDRTGGAMPAIGLALDAEDVDKAAAAARGLREAGVRSLNLRLRADTKDLPGVMRKAAQIARAIAAVPQLEIVLPGKSEARIELDLVAVAAAAAGFEPASVMVSPAVDLKSYSPSVDRPAGPALETLYRAARRAFPGVALGGGMFSYFTELNRRRVPAHLLDFVQHATSSIVHAADDRSVMETLESLPHIFRSARAMIGGADYRVGPANIGMPFNPYGASTTPNPHNRRITMVSNDPRQTALFGAAWAAGYLIRAAQGGVAEVSIMAPIGDFGILGETGPRPAFAVVKAFAALDGAAVIQTASSDPQGLLALAAEGDGGRELWIANLTPRERDVRLAGLRPVALAVMDNQSAGALKPQSFAENAMLKLGAYAVARLEA